MVLNVYRTVNDRVILTVVVGFADMQRRVKEESSHLAAALQMPPNTALQMRTNTGGIANAAQQGGLEYVLDEGYGTKFRSYFYSAQGELAEYLSAYAKDVPVTSELLDTSSSGLSPEDWAVQLPMPASFNESLSRAVALKVEDFFEAYIMWLWMSTKDASRAEVYLATATKLKEDIFRCLNKRAFNISRPHCYW